MRDAYMPKRQTDAQMTEQHVAAALAQLYRDGNLPQLRDRATAFVWAVLALSALAIVAILVIFTVRPDKDNTALIALVLGFLVPLVGGFLAAAIREIHTSVNGRLTQLLLLTQRSAHAEGHLAGTADAATAVRIAEEQRESQP